MSDFWHCLIPGWIVFLVQYCTALPVHASKCRTVDRGLYIGITGWVCDERRGLELRELLPFIPAEKLLIETDAPYLLPRDLTPKPTSRRNEPAYLPHILERIALWRGEDPQWLAAMTDANARTLFEVVF